MIRKLSITDLDKRYLSSSTYEATPISADFLKLVVNKPWGNEYLMYNNPSIEIWNLSINHAKTTSIHCHPNKKTSLLVLDGQAIFSSLSESIKLMPFDIVTIDAGAFHSTRAISENGVRLLEFETPPMKHDLIRLKDEYGRANMVYEGLDKMIPDGTYIRFNASNQCSISNYYCNDLKIMSVASRNDLADVKLPSKVLAVVINGSVFSKNENLIYTVADAFSLDQLTNNNYIYNNLNILLVRRNI